MQVPKLHVERQDWLEVGVRRQWCKNLTSGMWSRPKRRDQDMVKPSRPRPHQKIRELRIENLWIILIFFCKFSKNIVTTTKWQFFAFLAFSYLLWLFFICEYSRQKTRWFTKVLLTHIVAVLKASSESTCDGDQDNLKHSRHQLWKWEVLRPRQNLETPSLPNMEWRN